MRKLVIALSVLIASPAFAQQFGNTYVGIVNRSGAAPAYNSILVGTNGNPVVESGQQNSLNIGNALYGTGLGSSPLLGVGTSAPAYQLEVNGNTRSVGYLVVPTTVASSATPALVATNGLQTITLSANATPTITGIAAGQHVTFQICQPSSGGPYTWAWPGSVHGGMTIGTTASLCSVQSFDGISGTTLVAESAGIMNVAP